MTLAFLSGGTLATACVSPAGLEPRSEPGIRPVPLILDGSRIEAPLPTADALALERSLARIDRALDLPPGSSVHGSGSQTMGADEVDAALDAGSEEAADAGGEAGAGPEGAPEEGVAAPQEEDPFAGIGEGGDDAEPVDEWAAMSDAERATATRQMLQGDDEDAGDAPEEVAGDADDPRDVQPDGLPAEPSDEAVPDEPHSVLWYLDNLPPPSIQRFIETAPPSSGVPDAPPATRLPAYDLLDDETGTAAPEEAPDATQPAATLAPGIYVHPVGPTNADYAVGDPTLGSVVLGQPFHVSVAVPLDQVDKNGDGAVDDVTITFASEDGDQTVTLVHDPLQDSRDGVWVYRTATPISLAGKSQGMDVTTITSVEGTITGLDLDSYDGARTVTITADNQDFSAIDVYTNNTQHGIGMISDALDAVSNVLVGEIATIRKIRSDPEAMADSKVVAELDAWQARVDRRMGVVQRARTLLADPEQLPIVKVKTGQFYLERLFSADENGQIGVAEDVVPFHEALGTNAFIDFPHMDQYVIENERLIRDDLKRGLIEDVLPAYLLGIYDQFNTWNVPGAFAWTVGGALAGESTDHFGRQKSVTHAAVEMGLFVVMIKLPDVITDWAAGGFGAGRLPSIGVPRFRGTPFRGNVLVPKGTGRLALETRGGTQAYPGSATRPIHALPEAERIWWQGRVAARTPTDRFDQAMATATRDLDELDAVIQNAQRLGVPYAEIESALANARLQGFGSDAVQSLRTAIAGVRKELAVRGANADGKTIVVHPTEMQQFRDFANGVEASSLRQEDLLMIQGIKSRAEFEARHGGQPMYNPDEVAYARELLQHGDDLKNWLEFMDGEGLRYVFDDAAIADLRTVFGGSGPPAARISPRAGFPRLETRQQVARPGGNADAPASGIDSRADTVDLPAGGQSAGRPPTQELSPGEMEQAVLNAETVRVARPVDEVSATNARPLATLDEYRQLVARQAAGEPLDLKQIARPGIARVIDGRVMIQQGAGRWENTRPDDWLDLFVDARAALPEGAVVLQRGVSPDLVRQANLLSSRGLRGSNPPIIEAVTAGIPEFVRIRVRARDAQAPTSDVANAIDNELTALAAEGVDLTSLRLAMEPLSPNERLALLRNETARAQALQSGAAPTPPPPPPPGAGAAAAETVPTAPGAGGPRMSELDQRVIQKGFKAARGEAVDWTPEELTRLQQIAYPPSGARPSVVQQKLMPVAEQLGGQLKTQRQDARTFGEALDQANEAFLAHQEMEDLVDLARLVGVPEERILLHTEGLDEGMPATVLERASRGLLREVDQARGIIHEAGVPDDYFVITRMYVVAKRNGNRLSEADVAWLRERIAADENYIENLGRREFEDVTGEDFTIMNPSAAQELGDMYRAATGEGGVPVSQGPPSTIDPASGAAAAMLGGPSGRGGADAPVEVVILSTEGSTGPVMEAYFLNKGKPVRIQGQGIALEPVANVDAATMQRIEQIREAALQGKPVPGGAEDMDGWTGASVVRVALDAYCLEADLPVPTRGMLYRIADPARQAAFGSLRPILEASERLRAQGALHPSNNEEDYFHSIRQWALWVDEKDMDAEEFEDAFVAHAKRNFEAAGQEWNADVESVVRDYAPGRWQDVHAVLEAAGVR
jgi:hypothetical protein